MLSFALLGAIFLIDLFGIIKEQNKYFNYIKNICFGIFSSIFTAFMVSFYEYRKQIFSDFYIFIKQTNDCIKNIEAIIASENYYFCLVQVGMYKDTVKSMFVVRKLHKKNEFVIRKLNLIYNEVDAIYANLDNISKKSDSILVYKKQIDKLYQDFLEEYGESTFKKDKLEYIPNLKKQRAEIDNCIKTLTDVIQSSVKNCNEQLERLAQYNMELYEYINRSNKVFII